MDNYLIAVVLGIVEGITEFLPVSSTGHLIITGHLLSFSGAKAATFEIVIQLGAILAVVCLYHQRFTALIDIRRSEGFHGLRGILLLALTTLPAVLVGLATHDAIKEHLFSPRTVAWALAVGAILILVAERWKPRSRTLSIDDITPGVALAIGFFQCLALWPGFSRSAATIMGGLLLGVDRSTAAEYSFLAAVPVMFGATGYDLYKSASFLSTADVPFFAVGFLVSFIAALVAVVWFIKILQRFTLRPFAVYRFIPAVAVLLFL